ncbi:MAG: glycerol kinase GlpK [Saprospiraceae bacterium]
MSTSKYILALDAGTTSCRTLIFDASAKLVSLAQQEFQQHYPRPGWVEHDAEEIWEAQSETMNEAMKKAGITMSDVAAIGITNQRETCVAFSAKTGKALTRAIVWQDKRTSDRCAKLRADRGDEFTAKTGLIVDAYFTGSKMEWMLQHVDSVKQARAEDDLRFGTIDTWLVHKLTGGASHIMDETNASRTLVFDIHKGQWAEELLSEFSLRQNELPTVVESSGVLAKTDEKLFGAAVPIAGIAGDQQSALFGQRCFEAGQAKNTYGTGCFMLMHTGTTARPSTNGLVTTIAWTINGERHYALEGSILVAGAAVQWLRDGLNLFDDAAKSEAIASSVDDNGGVYVVPAFAGLGAPYWDGNAKGAIFGLTRGSDKRYLTRATLESLAYQTRDLIDAMAADSGLELVNLKVDGGASANNWLMQFQSDMIQRPVVRRTFGEATAMGAAFLAGLGVGMWSMSDLLSLKLPTETFEVSNPPAEIDKLYAGWQRAVKACQAFSE